MTKLKSLFIDAFLVMLAASLLHGSIALYLHGIAIEWLGVVIASMSNLLFFFGLFARGTARTSRHLWPLLVSTTFGASIAVWGALAQVSNWLPLFYAGFVLAGCMLYVFWYSRLGRTDNTLLEVGRPLPTFVVEDVDGAPVMLGPSFSKPAVLLFFRGNWCPLCMAQIREIAAQYRELDRRGVRVILISPQPHGHTRELAQKFAVPFHFYVDRDNRAAQALGILAKDGLPAGLQALGYDSDTVFPTVIMTDATGTIVFVDLTDNYRIRPEPQTFLRIADGWPT
ncbi:peroxiredoxin [Paraburkholderia fungorum]|uniref:peroxiredoxin-like family protein n=2 Tax=Paraburkholderia fungorum TaxID=134537 RepID=UPI0016089C1B|nr:peroxiredoxin-like family protein [Paraburkholderia fungorum]MBB4518605.1 peroxiredoxin [Paraburkholderia fungorum]